MKSVFSLYKLKMSVVLKSAVLVIPTVVAVAFLGAMYSFPPRQVSGSFLLSGFMLFVIGVYLSMMIQMKENDIQEEVLLFHSRSELSYYLARELVLVSVGLVYAIIIIGYPLIRNFLNPGYFTRPIRPDDVIYGGLIMVGSGLSGLALGDLFHHRIFRRARFAVIGVIFVSIIAVCKIGLVDKFPFLKALHYITPPITDAFKMVGDSDVFDKVGSLQLFAHMLLFSVAVVVIKIRMLKSLKW